MTVLVVEDQSNLSEPLQDQLEAAGHSCLTARDFVEADLQIGTVPIDVLVLDLDIPEAQPLEWLEDLGLARPELAASTVAITGRALGTEDTRVIEALGGTLLRKPFPIQKLHAQVLAHLGTRGGGDAIVDGPVERPGVALDDRDEV